MYDIPISYVAAPSNAYSSGSPGGSYASNKPVGMIGCTCGGQGPCRGTCRTPLH